MFRRPLGSALIFLIASSAIGWSVPVAHPQCPAYRNGTTWRVFLSGKVPRLPKLVGNYVGVEFRTAKQFADSAAIGKLRTDACYTVAYVTHPKGPSYPYAGYSSSRTFAKGGKGPDVKHGLPGDPNEYEINVYGVLLQFNDLGEVFDFKGRVVGTLTCSLRNECGNY